MTWTRRGFVKAVLGSIALGTFDLELFDAGPAAFAGYPYGTSILEQLNEVWRESYPRWRPDLLVVHPLTLSELTRAEDIVLYGP